ncbi:histidyl-tRNA synthetase [Methanolinea mesophila]|nr:histidyl-tRNA synthetase [Methanolinea mesophila]
MERRRMVEARLREAARRWGYREVCTPEFEELELFTLRSGEGIIQEMYVFEDKGGRSLALRPELTAPVLRMYVNEGKTLKKPLRWFYFADCFRYERPQKGRYRQFWQFGAELIGADSATAEAEAVMLGSDLLNATGVKFDLQVGHLSLMRSLVAHLVPDEQRRIRMYLDKKDRTGLAEYLDGLGMRDLEESLVALIEARSLEEALEVTGPIPDARKIGEVFSMLDAAGVSYTLNAGIARGLDYYTGTVFEAFAENLGAENQILGGGAYRLAHLFGGEDTPSCGFAIGFDRVMVALGEIPGPRHTVAGVAHTAEGRDYAIRVAARFRDAGIRTELDLSGKGIGAQLSNIARHADFALIIGEKEAEQKMVTLKNLASGEQKTVPLETAVREVETGVTGR